MPGHRIDSQRFGGTVALSGEWLAVSGWVPAPQHGHAARAPLVFLFKQSEGVWEYHSTLTAPAPAWHTNHVSTVPIALSGDLLAAVMPRMGRAAIYERQDDRNST